MKTEIKMDLQRGKESDPHPILGQACPSVIIVRLAAPLKQDHLVIYRNCSFGPDPPLMPLHSLLTSLTFTGGPAMSVYQRQGM